MGASDMRGALVLFEGLPPTVIDSQVLTHVRLVRERLGFDFSVIAVAHNELLYKTSLARLEQARQIAGGPVHVVRGVRPMLPGSMVINRLLFTRCLDVMGPISLIHARTDYAAAVAGPLACRRRIPMLWDCRGDSIAELQERLSDSPAFVRPFAVARESLLRRERRLAGQTCTAACFVSTELQKIMSQCIGDKPCWIVPCVAAEDEFFVSEPLREKRRTELGIAADEAAYIYSGSLAGYQCFEETVGIFRRVHAGGRKAKLIVLTPEVDAARQMTGDLPRNSVICKPVPHAEVNGFLNAADFGMLLRAPTPVNRVAFPTKFAEYSLAGLKVIMKDDPPSCVELAKVFGNYVPADRAASPLWSPAERARCAEAAIKPLGRLARMPAYAEIYKALNGSPHADVRPAA